MLPALLRPFPPVADGCTQMLRIMMSGRKPSGTPRWSYEGLKPWLRKAEEKSHVVSIGAAEEGKRQYRLRDPVKKAWAELGVTPNLKKEHGAIGGLTEMLENSREGQRQPSHVVSYPFVQNIVVHCNWGRWYQLTGRTGCTARST